MQDDPKEAAKLADFLRTQAPAFFAECKGPYDTNNTEQDLSRGQLLQAVFFLPRDCAQLHREESEQIARRAMENGTERQTLDHLSKRAERALQNASAYLDTLVPGSVVDVQVLSTFHEGINLGYAGLQTAANYFIPYQDGSRRDLQQLDFVLGGLEVGRRYAELLVRVAERYPWTPSVCIHPDPDELAARIKAKLDYATSLAAKLGRPEDEGHVTTKYGRLVQHYAPALALYAKNKWWAGLLDLEGRVEWDTAYWENFTADPLPTREEAQHLLAEYRSGTNTLWTEYRVDGYDLRMEHSPHPWEEDLESGGIIALSLPALRSPFLGLVCGPTGQATVP